MHTTAYIFQYHFVSIRTLRLVFQIFFFILCYSQHVSNSSGVIASTFIFTSKTIIIICWIRLNIKPFTLARFFKTLKISLKIESLFNPQ